MPEKYATGRTEWAIRMDDRSSHQFFLEVGRLLGGCQLVEQQLKLYLQEALSLAKDRGEQMPFKVSGSDFTEWPLGRLIKHFDKLSGNDALVAQLQLFKDDRNELVHTSVARCLDPDGELSEPEQTEVRSRAMCVAAESKRLVAAIHGEINKIRAQLYFDDVRIGPEDSQQLT